MSRNYFAGWVLARNSLGSLVCPRCGLACWLWPLARSVPSELLWMDLASSFSPCLSALPIFCSWVFWVAQQVHLHIASMSLGSDGLLVDRAPPPRIEMQHDTAHIFYADNASQFGMDPDIVSQRRHVLSKALNGRGLDTHMIFWMQRQSQKL